MDMSTQVQILDEVVYISPCTNTHRKDMNSSILHSTIGKQCERFVFLIFLRQPVEENI